MPIQYTFVNNIFFVIKNCFPIFTTITEICKRGVTGPALEALFEGVASNSVRARGRHPPTLYSLLFTIF